MNRTRGPDGQVAPDGTSRALVTRPLAVATALEKIETAAVGRPMTRPAGVGAIPATHRRAFWLKQIAAAQSDAEQ